MTNSNLNRRQLMKLLGLGSAGSLLGSAVPALASANGRDASGSRDKSTPSYAAGLPPVTIRSVKAIGTAPQGANLVIVKVETSEPGLYGVGCATFTQRAEVVVTAINNYLDDFCRGR